MVGHKGRRDFLFLTLGHDLRGENRRGGKTRPGQYVQALYAVTHFRFIFTFAAPEKQA